jgi:hypothetical protein
MQVNLHMSTIVYCWEYSESNLRPLAGLGHRKASYFLVSDSNPFPWNPCMYIHCICIHCIYIHCIYIHCIYIHIIYLLLYIIPPSQRQLVSPPFAAQAPFRPWSGSAFAARTARTSWCAPRTSLSHRWFTLLIMGIYDDLWGFIGIYRDL